MEQTTTQDVLLQARARGVQGKKPVRLFPVKKNETINIFVLRDKTLARVMKSSPYSILNMLYQITVENRLNSIMAS